MGSLVVACRSQFPDQESNPSPPGLEAWCPRHWTTRQGPMCHLLRAYCLPAVIERDLAPQCHQGGRSAAREKTSGIQDGECFEKESQGAVSEYKRGCTLVWG